VGTQGDLVTKPLDRFHDLNGALPFRENHFAGVVPDPEVEALAAYRAKLHAHQALYDQG
jgi:hypothetical protein